MTQENIQTQLEELEHLIAETKNRLQPVLSAVELEQTLRPLLDKQASLLAIAGEGSAIAMGDEAVAVAARGVHIDGDVTGSIITGDVKGNIYLGDPTDDPAEALRIYRRVVAQSTGNLSLRGMDIGASDPTSGQSALGLAHVYIDLDTTAQTKISDEELGGRPALTGERERRLLTALEAVRQNQHVVILGDPGSGKTTFVRHLAYCLAAGQSDHLPGWDRTDWLPLVIVLRDFAYGLPDPLPQQAGAGDLWEFITQQLARQNLGFAAKPLRQALDTGQVLVLLDGLDEIPTIAKRQFVRDALFAFSRRHPANRYLATCRTLSYQPPVGDAPDLRLPAAVFTSFELAPFDEAKVRRFVEAWHEELLRLGVIPAQDKAALTQGLQTAVNRPDLRYLATNPLLLTVMALVHTHKGRLPEARALLYEETIDILLWRWEQVKSGGRSDLPRLRQLLQEAGRSETDLKKTLWRLAFMAHAQVGMADDSEALADIGELQLEKALAALKGNDRTWAYQVIQVMKERAGLLLERAPERFTFPHRTFQEYLAGAHLASQVRFARQAEALAAQGALWREVILLAVGRLVYQAGDTEKPLWLTVTLCPEQMEEGDETAWRKVWLAGEVLLEMGVQRVVDTPIGQELYDRVRRRLLALITGSHLAARERVAAGDVLGRLGDPRPELLQVDEMRFCVVPAGDFWMGSEEQDDEKPLHLNQRLNYDYYLAQYPVTVSQFRQFVEETDQQVSDEDSLRDLDNRPVRYVTWYEALGFCRWLNQRWQDKGLLSQGWQVTLPSEAEWEKAARGGLNMPAQPQIVSLKDLGNAELGNMAKNLRPQRRFPWGDQVEAGRVNDKTAGINDSSALGCFPGSVTPYGCQEMSGNLFDWTRSHWGEDWQKPIPYPYEPGDGREVLEADSIVWRVLRGGAWAASERYSRCSARVGYNPLHRNLSLGFRVVVVPIFPVSDL